MNHFFNYVKTLPTPKAQTTLLKMNRRCSCCRQLGHNISSCPEIASQFNMINNYTSSREDMIAFLTGISKTVLERYVISNRLHLRYMEVLLNSKNSLIDAILRFKFPNTVVEEEENDVVYVRTVTVRHTARQNAAEEEDEFDYRNVLRFLRYLNQPETPAVRAEARFVDIPVAEAHEIQFDETIPVAEATKVADFNPSVEVGSVVVARM